MIQIYDELKNLNAASFDFSAFAIRVCHDFIDGLRNSEKTIITAQTKGIWGTSDNRHFHLFPEIFLQLQGGCKFEFPEQKLELLPSQILLIPAGIPHGEKIFKYAGKSFVNLVIMPIDDAPKIHLAIPPPSGVGAPTGSFGRRLKRLEGFQNLAEALSATDDLLHPIEQEAQRHLLIAILLKLIVGFEAPPAPQVERPSRHPKIEAARNHIASTFPIRIPEVHSVASAVGCSPNYLSMLFRRETGIRLTEYINCIRLDYARKMLKNGQHKIAAIAWSCGFQDASYFAELYRARFGYLPSEEQYNKALIKS